MGLTSAEKNMESVVSGLVDASNLYAGRDAIAIEKMIRACLSEADDLLQMIGSVRRLAMGSTIKLTSTQLSKLMPGLELGDFKEFKED